MNKMNPIRLLAAVSFLVMLVFPLSAQEKADSVLTFRFLSGNDMFFVPVMNNGEELSRLFDCVELYKEKITGREIYLRVDGYCISKGSKAENLVIARTRSNRVKSELITRKGLTEDCFITRNHAEKGDFVTVRIVIPNDDSQNRPEESLSNCNDAGGLSVTSVSEPEAECTVIEADAFDNAVDMPDNLPKVKYDSRFAMKTNILGYAVLMPNLELEWKFADRWSAALGGSVAWYAMSDHSKVYRVATVMPELRFWAVERSRWKGMYVGIFGGAGLYDLSNSTKGHEGEGVMAGLSVGYMWPIGKHLSLDAGAGAGYLRVRDKVYVPLDGHFLYQFTKNIDYLGPLRLKLSLVWRFQSEKTVGKK